MRSRTRWAASHSDCTPRQSGETGLTDEADYYKSNTLRSAELLDLVGIRARDFPFDAQHYDPQRREERHERAL